MQLSLLEYIRCPECEGALELTTEIEDGPEIVQGSLMCKGCSARYPVVRGVPRMNVRMEGLQSVADSFGFEWKAHHQGEMEDDTVFGRTPEEDWQYLLDGLGILDEDLDG